MTETVEQLRKRLELEKKQKAQPRAWEQWVIGGITVIIVILIAIVLN